MDGVAGVAHWLRERGLCETNAVPLNCLCSHYGKTDRENEYPANEIK